MSLNFIRKLFHKDNTVLQSVEQTERREPRFKLGNGFYWEFEQVYNGMGGYRMMNVYLLKINDSTYRQCIVNENGHIQNFPGFCDGEWKKELQYPLNNKILFDFWISAYKDGKAFVSWTLQPDGRYFEDEDGFGAENCEEVSLYSYLDEEGKFTEPFCG